MTSHSVYKENNSQVASKPKVQLKQVVIGPKGTSDTKPVQYAGGQSYVQVEQAGTTFANNGGNQYHNIKSTDGYSSHMSKNQVDQHVVQGGDNHESNFQKWQEGLNVETHDIRGDQSSINEKSPVTSNQTVSSSHYSRERKISEDYGKDGSVIRYHSSETDSKLPLHRRASLGAKDQNAPQRKQILKEFKRKSLTKKEDYNDGADVFAEETKQILVSH